MASDTENETVSSGESNKLMVAAIDLGTTYSGWAFSFNNDFSDKPTKVFCKQWNSGENISQKAPSVVLVQPDGLTLEAFGYEAEDRYAELFEENKHESFYFFQHFKMVLYENENFYACKVEFHRIKPTVGSTIVQLAQWSRQGDSQTLTIHEDLEDKTGKRLPAKRVFAMAIRYLKDSLLDESGKKLLQGNVKENEIQWVVTVPAIWNFRAKQFMRECAIEAGIKSSNLILALEPEAASLYCKHISIERQEQSHEHASYLRVFQPGAKYMVVDAGGGTVDIVVHEVGKDGRLKEIVAANGGCWGGTTVDKAYDNFLSVVFTDTVMTNFRKKNVYDYLCIHREFEVKKRKTKFDSSVNQWVRIRVPLSLLEMFKEIHEEKIIDRIQREADLSSKIKLMGDKMSIDSDLIKRFFDEPINAIISHLQSLMQQPSVKGIYAILMVGGFSEAEILFDAIKDAFGDKQVIIPRDADLAVLTGAVIYGHSKKEISLRKSRYFVGISTFKTFDPKCHPPERMSVVDGKQRVARYLTPLINKGDEVIPYTTSASRQCVPLKGQTKYKLEIFAWKDAKTQFADEVDCIKVFGHIFDCVDNEGDSSITINLLLGGTEFEVNMIQNSTGTITSARFNMLE